MSAALAQVTDAPSPDASGADPSKYAFFSRLARVLNSGQSRSVLLTGEVHDLFHAGGGGEIESGEEPGYVPLIDFLTRRCQVPGITQLVYELNGPIRLVGSADWETLRDGWVSWRLGKSADELAVAAMLDRQAAIGREKLEADFEAAVNDAVGKPTVALELLRQIALCSRSRDDAGRPYIADNLLMFIEAADLLLPAGRGDVTGLSASDRLRVSIVADWFSDASFVQGADSVVMIADGRSAMHERVARLPSVTNVEVDAPDEARRLHYLKHFRKQHGDFGTWAGDEQLAAFTAGLSVHALRQLLLSAHHDGRTITPDDVTLKVEQHIAAELGDDVVEFKKPEHRLEDVVGATRLKTFLREEMIPRIKSDGPDALPGAAVAGPIGSGKTFIFEAVAAELGVPVLVLKNVRSQWFGQTDVLFEKLRRVLTSLGKVVIFIDEADTQFGGVGAETHSTERRLTGKIQQMMSDTTLRGRVTWLLMTARIHLLSPDIRRPGRVGDLIIPVLDPAGDDRRAFLRWMIDGRVEAGDASGGGLDELAEKLDPDVEPTSAAAFASLRGLLGARRDVLGRKLTFEEVQAILHDQLPPAIGQTRRYQELQALVNCTRRSLLPEGVTADDRESWEREVRQLEALGVR